eukprot:CAMPEP_0170485668 /NCGR_PEP_ID=MMETSP0208-20121228/4879_1 /TAXON_ID=197538 /ORGANISM="Strombidium inclinatum, Strain S3" /LENGTH=142 /DNA_ID=CAMNT_0010759377 /DNA_START=591 /DNA_END=1019 /DNA_ORIENTATION=+
MKKGDYLYVALAHPYSYADYLLSLKEVAEKCKINENQIFCQVDQLCTSLEGRDVHLLTLASHHAIETRRPIIFLTGRVHAGESPGSYLVQGVLDKLTNFESEQSQMLLNNFVFKIVPMLNPDGVSRGYWRRDILGYDMNRVY